MACSTAWVLIKHIDTNKVHFLQVEVKRALPKEVQQQQAALRAAVAGRGMLPAAIGETIIQQACTYRI